MAVQVDRRKPAVSARKLEDVIASAFGGLEQDLSIEQLDELTQAFKRRAAEHFKSKLPIKEYQLSIFTPQVISTLVDSVYIAYNSADRAISSKAGEFVQAISNLNRVSSRDKEVTEGSERISQTFIKKAVARESFDKHDLQVLNQLLPYADPSTWPDNLMDRIFIETWSHDSRFVAGRVLVSMFDSKPYLDRLKPKHASSTLEELVVQTLLDKVAEIDHTISVKPMSQFVFPVLFERQPKVVPLLCERLSGEISTHTSLEAAAALHFWIRVAAIACQCSLVEVQSLDSRLIALAMHHQMDEIRLAAWTALTARKAVSDRIDVGTLGMVKEWFESSMRVYNADFRGAFGPSFRKYIERIRLSSAAAQKQIDKPLAKSRQNEPNAEENWAEEKMVSQQYITSVIEFLQHVLNLVITPALELPSFTGHARVITGLDLIHSLALEVPLFADKIEIPLVFTDERVDYLLACLGGNFSDVRAKALDILMLAPIPLPGYLAPESSKSLLDSAYARLDGKRKSDAEAGSLVVQVLCREETAALNERPFDQIQLLEERLDQAVEAAEKDLINELRRRPLHGIVLAITRIISSTKWKSSEQLMRLSKRLISQIHRIWQLSRPILSSEGSSAADHEIARIYEMLAQEGGQDLETEQDSVHIDLLSNAWRAVKESSTLLAEIFVVTTAMSKSCWSPDEVKSAGDLYLTWLYRIRHRGTFSSIAPDFDRFVNVIAHVSVPGKDELTLRESWLDTQLDVVAGGSASTTRRSAAIPSCVLALAAGSRTLFSQAHKRLSSICSSNTTPNPAKVHALHTLRVIVLDTRHTKVLGDFFQETAAIALQGCENPDWSVRNAALLLFAQLATRMFGKGLNSPGTVYDKRIGIHEWSGRYPMLLPRFRDILDNAILQRKVESSAMLILVVLRHLESRDGLDEQLEEQERLRSICAVLCDQPDIKLRQAAADAHASLTPRDARLTACRQLLADGKLSSDSDKLHGHLLAVLGMVRLRVDAKDADYEETWKNACDAVAGSRPSATIKATLVELLTECCAGIHDRDLVTRMVIDRVPLADTHEVGYGLWKSAYDELQKVISSESQSPLGGRVNPLELALTSGINPYDRIQALEDVLAQNDSGSISSGDYQRLMDMYDATTHVPLREAILPVLGRSCLSGDSSMGEDSFKYIVDQAGKCLHEDESADSRIAAVRTISSLIPALEIIDVPPSLHIRTQLLLKQALSDDDVDIRDEAASIVSKVIQSEIVLCRDRAVGEWWKYMSERYAQVDEWKSALRDMVTDVRSINDLRKDLHNPNDELFANEPSNLFIEPWTDLQAAYDAYRRSGQVMEMGTNGDEMGASVSGARGDLESFGRISPLALERDSLVLLARRVEVLERVLGHE